MGDSKQQIREHIMTQIPHIMLEFLQGLHSKGAVRILGDVFNSAFFLYPFPTLPLLD